MKKVIAIVENEKCFPMKCQHECMKYDPLNRKEGKLVGFHLDEKTGKATIAEELVTEMHKISAKKCPFGAIAIVKVPDELNEEPLHKFGPNAFRLYSLARVKENQIVGVIGRNGIGKSTALQMLTGNLLPNVGNYEQPPGADAIIGKYSTTWMGEYFRKVVAKEVKIAYKPQRVELLATVYRGEKVTDLLQKVNERGVLQEVIEALELQPLLQRNVEVLSGGELQRVAIAATLVKNFDLAFFDEPSSFLDITFRIKVARLLRGLCANKAVVLVDHDLATLDYICDEVQVVYGEPAAYGIFSQSKSVRRGINEYLDGFLPDENMRFRSYPIRFAQAPMDRVLSREVAWEMPALEKKFEAFALTTVPAKIHAGEVLAIMGANGLGKSTYMRMLAGLEKPDNAEINLETVAYKPQYLEQNIEGTVEELLKKKLGAFFESGWFRTNILEKLNVQKILLNDIKKLSGGELQKVHIALTLTPSAKLVMMDEPSAFIDVEDRLNVAGIIKDFVGMHNTTAIIVDHDIQFVDFLADSMLVFEGTPGSEGKVHGPFAKREGMNRVLKSLDITYRRDKETLRPRINKPGSQLDQQQRAKGEYYYT